MKVDRIIKISEKFTTYAHHLDKLYYKKTLDKIIPISKDVKHSLSCFLNNSKFNRIGGYSHIMTKNRATLKIFFATCHTIFK